MPLVKARVPTDRTVDLWPVDYDLTCIACLSGHSICIPIAAIMATSDKVLGMAMLGVAAFVFIYYTFWALLTPFLPASSPLLDLFPPREYAVALPAILVLIGGAGVAAFIGRVMMKEAQKRRVREGKAA